MSHAPLLKRLVLVCLGMFAFAFALVPLYDVFCDITGLNGKPSLEQAEESMRVVDARQVDVSFTTHAQSGAPFDRSSRSWFVLVRIVGPDHPGTLATAENSDIAVKCGGCMAAGTFLHCCTTA